MSMLGSFFNRGFKASQCKTLMKLTIPRIKLLRNRREIQLKQMRKEIAKLLETGQEATARIRVEHIIREENMMAAQEILELFCELIVVRLPIIESQKECPLDLKEAISSVCFAAPRCADLSELQQVQLLFASKYGNEFVAAATELMPNCGVNRQLIELLSVRAPSPEKKLKFLKDIAVEHELDWDPAASETEFFKPHEDLLTGPSQFISGSTLPMPKVKHDEALNSALDQPQKEQANSDVGLDDLDLPEVPKVPVEATGNAIPLTPEAVPFYQIDDESCLHSGRSTDFKEELHLKDEEIFQERVAAVKDDPQTSLGSAENKQFLPFIAPLSVSNASPFSMTNASYSETSNNSPSTDSWKISEAHVDLQEVLAATETAEHVEAAGETSKRVAAASGHSPPSLSGKKRETYVDLQDAAQSTADKVLEAEAAAEIAKRVAAASGNSPSTLSGKKSEANVDLQNILAAAKEATDTAERAEAAAESAKHAAAAARLAASLAQDRISELTKNNGANDLDSSCENPFHASTSNQHDTTEPTHFNAPICDYDEALRSHSASRQGYDSSEGLEASFDKLKVDFDSSVSYNHELGDTSVSHQPKRLPSMDDETYFSYPNLFTSQNSRGESHSPSETGQFTHDL